MNRTSTSMLFAALVVSHEAARGDLVLEFFQGTAINNTVINVGSPLSSVIMTAGGSPAFVQVVLRQTAPTTLLAANDGLALYGLHGIFGARQPGVYIVPGTTPTSTTPMAGVAYPGSYFMFSSFRTGVGGSTAGGNQSTATAFRFGGARLNPPPAPSVDPNGRIFLGTFQLNPVAIGSSSISFHDPNPMPGAIDNWTDMGDNLDPVLYGAAHPSYLLPIQVVELTGQSFVNGGFQSGLTGWTVANTTNGTGAPGTVTPIDIDGPGPLGSSNAATFAAGQAAPEPGVQRGVEMTQILTLFAGTEYIIDFDWSAQKFSGANAADGGRFSLIVNGTSIAQAIAGSTGPTLPRYGHLTGSFTPSVTGPVSVGVRVTRAFTPAADLFQYVDNVTIGAAPCYPDCNTDGALTVANFGCFQTKFVLQDPYADCNGAGGLTVADFGCFQTAFVAGCP